ncbi:hypothetical protein HBB16_21900 [Pseudonocardia sp. MCCB 268]|nr:hypothetical protein [Pseudonocardia cytotoxica]
MSENTPRLYEVYRAAQRSGLATAVNHHLSAPEAAYIVRPRAKAPVVSGGVAGLAAAIEDHAGRAGPVSRSAAIPARGRTPTTTLRSCRRPGGPRRLTQPRGADMLLLVGDHLAARKGIAHAAGPPDRRAG